MRHTLLDLEERVQEGRLVLPALSEAREVEVLMSIHLNLHALILDLASLSLQLLRQHNADTKRFVNDHDAERLEVKPDFGHPIGRKLRHLGQVPLSRQSLDRCAVLVILVGIVALRLSLLLFFRRALLGLRLRFWLLTLFHGSQAIDRNDIRDVHVLFVAEYGLR